MENCNNHDHATKGKCLLVRWKGAVSESSRYQRTSLTEEQKQAEVIRINKEMRALREKLNVAPF